MRSFGQFAMRRAKFLVIFVLWLYIVRPEPALAAATMAQRQAEETVARDLKLTFRSDQLRLLGPSASLPEGAAMRVISARPGFAPGTWLLRLDCEARRDCLPFHAILQLPADEDRHLREQGGVVPVVMKKRPRAQPLARRGDDVVLVEQMSGMRLRMKVVCLESGAVGEQIRVRNRATRRVLLATVAGPGLVQVMR